MAEERKAEISAAASALFDEILYEILLDTTVSAHREIKRGRVTCGVCGTKCRSHNPLNTTAPPPPSSSQSTIASRAPSPLPSSSSNSTTGEARTSGHTVGPEKGTGGATGIGSGSGRIDSNGNAFFACLVCDRQVVSSKYAPHLSSCLGFAGSTRRTASRAATASASANASAKARLGQDKERSGSPYVASEAGDSDDASGGGSLASKKAKALNGNGKRGISPKKAAGVVKKPRLGSGAGTPSPLPRAALPPSKLGRPPTTASQPGSARLSTASTSPDTATSSLPETGGTGASAPQTKSTGRKTIPGGLSSQAAAVPPAPAPVVDLDDSDEMDDDY